MEINQQEQELDSFVCKWQRTLTALDLNKFKKKFKNSQETKIS